MTAAKLLWSDRAPLAHCVEQLLPNDSCKAAVETAAVWSLAAIVATIQAPTALLVQQPLLGAAHADRIEGSNTV